MPAFIEKNYVGRAAGKTMPLGCSSHGSATLIQINDPIGRWGLVHSPDPRFSGDTNNTTIHAATGYPMCVPRVDPAAHPERAWTRRACD